MLGQFCYDLDELRHVYLVGAGKACDPMARAVSEILDGRLENGIGVVKEGYLTPHKDNPNHRIEFYEAGHPLPDQRGAEATQAIVSLLNHTGEDDLVIFVISGGGSALLTSPIAGIDLTELQSLTSDLLASGANIYEINTLRKHLDQVKGGQLARLAAPAKMISLILSDVVGDSLDVIASGPTVPDSSTYTQALGILEKYHLGQKTAKSILDILAQGSSGEIPETPKPGDPLFQNVQNVVIGSNRIAAQAAEKQAQADGFQTLLLTTFLQGEARQAGMFLGSILRQIAATGEPLARPACIITGGETTVTLHGSGFGGRNQELALGAVNDLHDLEKVALISMATDGGDGPTDAAGAAVTGQTLNRAREAGLSPTEYLARNDSFHFFEALGDLLITGPTQTNVNDLQFLFAF